MELQFAVIIILLGCILYELYSWNKGKIKLNKRNKEILMKVKDNYYNFRMIYLAIFTILFSNLSVVKDWKISFIILMVGNFFVALLLSIKSNCCIYEDGISKMDNTFISSNSIENICYRKSKKKGEIVFEITTNKGFLSSKVKSEEEAIKLIDIFEKIMGKRVAKKQ